MSNDDKKFLWLLIIGFVFVLSVLIFFNSYMVMTSFNKFSSKKATLKDAIFLELRVFADGK